MHSVSDVPLCDHLLINHKVTVRIHIPPNAKHQAKTEQNAAKSKRQYYELNMDLNKSWLQFYF
jgi:hypothetical protein